MRAFPRALIGALGLGLMMTVVMPAAAADRLAEADRLIRDADAIWGQDMVRIDTLLRHALTLREQALPPGDTNIADTLGMLGRNAFNQGQMPDADRWFRRQLALEEQARPFSLETARALGDLGATMREECQLPQAEQLVRRSLALRQALSADGIVWWRAGSHDNLSKIHELMGRLDDAIADTINAADVMRDTGTAGDMRRRQYTERLICLRHRLESGAPPCWPTPCPVPIS